MLSGKVRNTTAVAQAGNSIAEIIAQRGELVRLFRELCPGADCRLLTNQQLRERIRTEETKMRQANKSKRPASALRRLLIKSNEAAKTMLDETQAALDNTVLSEPQDHSPDATKMVGAKEAVK